MPAALFMFFGYQQILNFVAVGSPSVDVSDKLCKVFAELRKVETVTLCSVLRECAKILKLVTSRKLKNAGAGAADVVIKAGIFQSLFGFFGSVAVSKGLF